MVYSPSLLPAPHRRNKHFGDLWDFAAIRRGASDEDRALFQRCLMLIPAEQTEPIIAFYRHEGLLITIPAIGEVAAITDDAIRALAKKLG